MDIVANKTVGIVGFGHIGKICAKYAKAMGMRVIALRRDVTNPDSGALADKVYCYEERAKLLSESDFVICALPGTETTKDFFGYSEFSSMKKSAVFISLGRGLCVDEDALVKAIREEKIKGGSLC